MHLKMKKKKSPVYVHWPDSLMAVSLKEIQLRLVGVFLTPGKALPYYYH